MLRDELKKEISRVAGADIEIKLVEPERSENGDYSTNLAFLLAKKKGKSPNDIAEEVAHKLRSAKSDLIDRADSVGGFVNVWVKDEALIKKLSKNLKFLEGKKLVEKKEGAIWLGDAVLVKSDAEFTYFLVDLSYHFNKFFDRK